MPRISLMAFPRLIFTLGIILCGVSLVSPSMGDESLAATYYLSPTGSDANAGTSVAAPWKTFRFALPKLQPLDTLLLLDGVYDGSNSGFPDITNIHGSPGFPIT